MLCHVSPPSVERCTPSYQAAYTVLVFVGSTDTADGPSTHAVFHTASQDDPLLVVLYNRASPGGPPGLEQVGSTAANRVVASSGAMATTGTYELGGSERGAQCLPPVELVN